MAFAREGNDCRFCIGCSSYGTNQAFVWCIEAARQPRGSWPAVTRARARTRAKGREEDEGGHVFGAVAGGIAGEELGSAEPEGDYSAKAQPKNTVAGTSPATYSL